MDIKIDSGTVNIRGKEYKTVALRVNEFRLAHPDWTIETLPIEIGEKSVLIQAMIKDPTGRVIATGLAEESRTSSAINRTSAAENCETSAVGRALAFFGLAGSEIASADEVAAAIGARAVPVQPVDLSVEIRVLEAAQSMDGLAEAWNQVTKAHRGNTEAISRLTQVKESRKRVLSVTGVFSGTEVSS
jgi:hypothetical protein